MSHGPIEQQHHELMNTIAGTLDEIFNGRPGPGRERTVGFALLVYPLDQGPIEGTGRINYIGNGDRAEVLIALKELVARWEGRVPTEGGRA
jgi:hypothetical protein